MLAEAREAMDRGQAERLLPLCEALLARAGLGWRDLDVIGVGTGPGNFTGLRIGVAAARGLALGLGVRAVGVPAGDALSLGLGGVTVALPAPRGDVYLIRGSEVLRRPAPAALPEGWPARVAGPGVDRVAGAAPVAAAPWAPGIARLAAEAGADAPPPAPLYLRAADAAPASDPPPVLLDG